MPLLDLFWTILLIFLFAAWIWVLISVLADVFRSDISGWSKALWILFMIIIPWLGVLVYLIVHGGDMQRRSAATAIAVDEAQRNYIRSVAGTQPSVADELSKLAELRDAGVITDGEYENQKAKLLA
jgi:hypothetical protein